MTIGFTGTRNGMDEGQREQFRLVLAWLVINATVLHHGDCHDQEGGESADHQAARMAGYLGIPVLSHRPRSFRSEDLLARNRAIVAAADILIAAPETDEEQLRSGTWATIRYARAKGIPIVMLSRGK